MDFWQRASGLARCFLLTVDDVARVTPLAGARWGARFARGWPLRAKALAGV